MSYLDKRDWFSFDTVKDYGRSKTTDGFTNYGLVPLQTAIFSN